MKRLAFVLLVLVMPLWAACEPDPAQLDHPVMPSATGAFSSSTTPGEPGPDAGVPGGLDDGGIGGIDGGPISDAGGLGPDGATQLDAGIVEFFDASVPPTP
jgi:hypothetical protein